MAGHPLLLVLVLSTAVFSCLALAKLEPPVPRPVKVAIIGAGAGGSSSAYHLSQAAVAHGIPLDITIFDRENRPGGRSTTVNAYNNEGFPVELGASIFVEVNRILMEAVETFNLSTTVFIESKRNAAEADLGVWDGKKFVFIQQGRSGWWDLAKMLWKYGLAPVRTIRLMRTTVAKFLKMYDEPVFPWSSLSQVVQDVDLLPVTAVTGEQYMADNGITGNFGHDIVQASTRVNYAQNLRYIHALEAMVCMAARGAISVQGGNWLIFDNMVNASRATRRMGVNVSRVEKQQNGSYVLGLQDSRESRTEHQLFDTVILAAPQQYAEITFDLSPRYIPSETPYVHLHVTLFASPHRLSPTFFGLQAHETVPRSVLTTLPESEPPMEGAEGCGTPGFWSISLVRTVQNPLTGAQEYLYKIFSPQPVKPTLINNLLGTQKEDLSDQDVTWIFHKEWNSYPYEFPRVTFEEIRLDDDLWYTSGIESFISTMETSALMGKNVARLVVDQWRDRLSDTGDIFMKLKDEKHTQPEL